MAVDSKMEILKASYCLTTTQFAVNSNTDTVSNILNPDKTVQYYSDAFNNDATTSTMRISFDATTTVDRIALLGMNLKQFRIYYNGTTANTFAMTSTGATTTSYWTSNSETSMYLRLNGAIACTSVSIDMYSTQVANSEKAIGHLIISQLDRQFERQPNAASYNAKIDPEQVVHTMSDGGTRIHTVNSKYVFDVKMKYVSRSFKDYLQDLYSSRLNFIFCPFGTATSWDEIIADVVWAGNFDFFKFSDDASNSGFSGSISLRETSL
jgi:hypothetical protein